MTLSEPVAWAGRFAAVIAKIIFSSIHQQWARNDAVLLGFPRFKQYSWFFSGPLLLFICFATIFVYPIKADETVQAIPTRLVIPGIQLDSTIVPVGWKKINLNGQIYGQWLVDDNRVGWHNLSARLGQGSNTVLNGHSNRHGRIFKDFHRIAPGDVMTVFTDKQTYSYIVTQKILVQEKDVALERRIENAKLILPTPDERLTLITCAGPEARFRFIIIAHPN
jgi:sortase A